MFLRSGKLFPLPRQDGRPESATPLKIVEKSSGKNWHKNSIIDYDELMFEKILTVLGNGLVH
jgi:hypothetical protein